MLLLSTQLVIGHARFHTCEGLYSISAQGKAGCEQTAEYLPDRLGIRSNSGGASHLLTLY
jgi:hypothetical protein